MKKSSLIIGIVILVVVLAGAAWYAYSNPQIAAALGLRHAPAVVQGNNGTGTTTPGGHFGGMRGGFATGSIEVLNDNGFTITLSGGTTKVVVLSATTTLQNYASASSTPTAITADQLSVGEQVFVIGSSNADGSITASRVTTGVLPTAGRGRGMYGTPHQEGGSYPPPTATN